MKRAGLLFLLIAALAFASYGSDEPRYADPEAHEKTRMDGLPSCVAMQNQIFNKIRKKS
jgi:hypothetical protein